MNIYVGNLPWKATEDTLKEAFGAYGDVVSVKIITDKFTGKSKGFAFVEMSNDLEAEAAINELNGKDFLGRNLKVNKAKPKEESSGNRRGGSGNFRGSRNY